MRLIRVRRAADAGCQRWDAIRYPARKHTQSRAPSRDGRNIARLPV